MRITACHNAKEPKRKQKKVDKILPMEWMLGPRLPLCGRWQGPVLVLLRLSSTDE